MFLLEFSVDASFMAGGSCFSKVFLVPDPLIEPVDLHGTPAVCSVFNEAKRSVMVARCASSGGVLGVENVVGILGTF